MQPSAQDPAATAPLRRARGRPRKTEDERDDGNRRRELLRSAGKLFRHKGFAATSTRDIAAAVGMRSGSPFYHFESKQALLFAVMEEGMQWALGRQGEALLQASRAGAAPRALLAALVRNHFEVLLGPGSDFIPVMLYEARSITTRQAALLNALRRDYESAWIPVLDALHREGALRAEVKLARLLIFGALNWSVQWFDRRHGADLDQLSAAALDLFLGKESSP